MTQRKAGLLSSCSYRQWVLFENIWIRGLNFTEVNTYLTLK